MAAGETPGLHGLSAWEVGVINHLCFAAGVWEVMLGTSHSARDP